MSIKALNWAYDQNIKSSPQKFILVTLADISDDYGICWPGFGRIAEKTALSRRAVIQNIKALEEQGLVEKVTRPKAGYKWDTNAYRLPIVKGEISDHPLSSLFKEPSAPDAPPSAPDAPPSAPDAPPSAPDAPPSAPDAPEPLLTPHITNIDITGLDRNGFLREIDRAFQKDELGEFKDLTETELKHEAAMCFDTWAGTGKWPAGDPLAAYRNFLRNRISAGKIKKPAKPKARNASRGEQVDWPEHQAKYAQAVKAWKSTNGYWHPDMGPPPDDPDTEVPTEVLSHFKIYPTNLPTHQKENQPCTQ